jgi:pimeloyl-ACP methyl ester carboxylesterase
MYLRPDGHPNRLPPTLVLLPGLDGTGDLFSPLIAALGSVCSVQVMQYPTNTVLGYGELEQFVRSALPQGEYVLVGESFSGPIAISIAADHPPGLAGLILCCTFASCPRPVLKLLRPAVKVLPLWALPIPLLSFALCGRQETPELKGMLAAALRKVSPSVLRKRLLEVLRVDVTRDLKRIQVPTLYLRADHDWIVPVSAGEQIMQHLPGAELATLEGPHFLLQLLPARAAAMILGYLVKCRSVAA